MPNIPILDLAPIHQPLREEILSEITRVVDTQRFIMGRDIELLEQEIAAYCGSAHGIACASGSDALYLALIAAGVSHGDQVLTTPFSFFATAGAITRAGATPVFVDIDPVTYNINPNLLAKRASESRRAKAVIPVHLYGGAADMDPILDSAREAGAMVIEDGAQSIGAEYKGRRTQSLGDIGCISFFPTKNLGCFGDGGMLVANVAVLAKKIAALRLHGSTRKYFHEWVGINSRMDTLQAAILRVKFRHLDSWTAARQRNAALYRQSLAGVTHISLPATAPYQTRHVFNQFVLRCQRRDALKSYLRENGVGTEIYYPLPLHLQGCFKDLGYRQGDFPESEKAAKEVLALPVYPGLTPDEIEYIGGLVRRFE